MKNYCKSVLWTRANQKALLSMEVLQRRENQKAFTKESTKKRKNAIDETEHEEPSETDNPVINEPSYFNIFECGKNLLIILDTTREQACMATSRERYYTKMFKTLTDYNYCKHTPL